MSKRLPSQLVMILLAFGLLLAAVFVPIRQVTNGVGQCANTALSSDDDVSPIVVRSDAILGEFIVRRPEQNGGCDFKTTVYRQYIL